VIQKNSSFYEWRTDIDSGQISCSVSEEMWMCHKEYTQQTWFLKLLP